MPRNFRHGLRAFERDSFRPPEDAPSCPHCDATLAVEGECSCDGHGDVCCCVRCMAEYEEIPPAEKCPEGLCRGGGWLFAPNMDQKMKPCVCRQNGRFETKIEGES